MDVVRHGRVDRAGIGFAGADLRSRSCAHQAGAGAETTLYLNDPASGARVEKVTAASGDVQWNDYLFADARLIGQHYTNIASGVTTTKVNYFVSDSLGSVAVITDGAGAVAQRLDYDPWGKRTLGSSAQTTRGYTRHWGNRGHTPTTKAWHASPFHFYDGISTVSTTWMTPLDWLTSAIVTFDVPPFASVRITAMPRIEAVSVSP
jgi:hypothetical protein